MISACLSLSLLSLVCAMQLDGSVPSWGVDGGMTEVQVIDLSHNALTGPLPQSLTR